MKQDYVEIASVIRRLNEVYGEFWSFQVKESKSVSKKAKIDGRLVDRVEVVVIGSLSVPTFNGIMVKEQYGSSDVKAETYGDAHKSAASDALKKCATLLGVALHLYVD